MGNLTMGHNKVQRERETGQDGPSGDLSQAARGGTDTTAALSKDAIFDLLRVRRRRRALRWLAEWNGVGTTGTLADHIAAEENGVTVRELTSRQRKRVYISLYQCHLPKLADCGVIAFDQARGDIELTETADLLFPYLELAESSDAGTGGRVRTSASFVLNAIRSWR